MPKHTSLFIKLGKIYINPLTILLFIFCYINRQLETLAITYAIMLIHESAHLAAAIYIGLVPSHIIIEPFGVNLRLKNQIVYSLADEILLYLAGPFINIIFALIATIANTHFKNNLLSDFIIKNLALFVINILPIVPLDGGIISKKILSCFFGSKTAEFIMKIITGALICTLSTLGVILTIKSQFNFSIIFLCVFLIMNIFMQKEKYNITFIKELMFYKKKSNEYKNKKVQLIAVSENDKLISIAEKFTKGSFYITFVLNDKCSVDNILTETEIMDKIIKYGAKATLAGK